MNEKKSRSYKKYLNIIIILIFNHNLIANVLNVRLFDHNDKKSYTRVVFEMNSRFSYIIDEENSSNNITFDVLREIDQDKSIISNRSKIIDLIENRSINKRRRFIIRSDYKLVIWRKFVLKNPYRVVIDFEKTKKLEKNNMRSSNIQEIKINKNKIKKKPSEDIKIKAEKKNDTISIICIDAGHGGENYGAVGKYLKEKDITLKISKELEKLITNKLKLKVLLIRDKDTDVSLNKRAEIANNKNADLFISIHVNSSTKKGAKGPETYFVSLKATDKESFELAKKENKSFKEIEDKVETDGLKMILWNMAQTDYIRHSSVLADFIQKELNVLMSTRNRGVKQAPFRVLMRVAMPAVLVEIGFLSNRKEEKLMRKKEFYKKAALAIYRGLQKYIKK